MDAARWHQIEELLQAALDRTPRERARFLTDACGDDDDLRREVDALLAGEADEEFLSRSPALAFLQRPAERPAGQTISHYRITAKIGAGGMGEVYEAHDQNLQRTVALKVLPEEFTGDGERVRRFEQEAFAASRLNHPNIITIFEILHADGAHLIATERIEGETLRDLLKKTKLDLEKALDVAIQIAAALKAAHTAWIIHRDIKPENLMVRADGLVKVLDFGIAKLSEEPAMPAQPVDDPPSAEGLTAAGAVLGTASYMSPEQARGEAIDGRTDLYSLGLVLYEMVAGERLFSARHRAEEVPKAKLDKVPKEIQPIVRKLLRTNRDERYSTAGDLLDDLHRVKRRLESRTARRMIGIGALAIAVAIVVAAIAAVLSVNEVWEERVLRDGHRAAARQALFSPDGRQLLSCGEDGQVIVWDFARRERIATLTSHRAHRIAWSPDGRWFVTGGVDGTIVIWDAARRTPIRTLRAHDHEVGALVFSRDATRLASASNERAIVWDTGTWRKVRERSGGTSYGAFLFTPDGRHLLLTTNVTMLDLTDGTEQAFSMDLGANWIALAPDEQQLAAVTPHGGVTFWRLAGSGKERRVERIANLRAHQDHGRSIAYSPDGTLLASAAEVILLWDPKTRRKVARFEYSAIVWSVAFSPDGRWLLSTHGDGAVLIWDVAERELVASLNEHSGAVRAVAFAPDGRRVASGGEDRNVTLWDVASGRKEAVFATHDTRVTGVAFTADGRQLVSVDQKGHVALQNVATRAARVILHNVPNVSSYAVQPSPDGRFVASTEGVSTFDGRMLVDWRYRSDFGQAYGLDFTRDGRLLVAVTNLGVVTLVDGRDLRRIEERRYEHISLITVSASDDGKWLVTGEDGGAVRLWSVRPLREVAVIGRHAARVKSVAFSPDGKTVVSAGDDKMIALWDVRRRELRARIGTHATPVYAVAFSPDGRRIVSGEHDRTVRVYTRQRTLWGMRLE